MELCVNSVLSDVNVPNHIDELDELLNSTWDHREIDQGDIDALYAELNLSLMLTPVASPVSVQDECDVFSVKKECGGMEQEQVACSAMLTPQASPRMCTDVESVLSTQEDLSCESFPEAVFQQRVPDYKTDLESQQVGPPDYTDSKLLNAVHEQHEQIATAASPNGDGINKSEQINKTVAHTKCAKIIQPKEPQPLYNLQASNQASIRAAPIHVSYQSPKEVFLTQTSFSPTTYIPYYTQHSVSHPREPCNEYSIPPNTVNIAQQDAIPIFTLASQQTQESDTCCAPADSIEPAPGMSCAEYLSSVQLTSDCAEPPDTSTAYFIYVPESQISPTVEQAAPTQYLVQSGQHQPITTVSIPSNVCSPEPTIRTIDPLVDYVQIQNNYVLPADGSIKAYPVEEIYRVAEPKPARNSTLKKKPRKANINYGTEFYCHICRKQFGKRGSFQQHWRQKHEETRPFRCDTCGKSYLTERDLRLHQQNHDPGMKQWKCTECDSRYRHMKDRDRHYDTHHGTPAHPCMVEGCDKAFARRDHMLAHLVSHDNRTMREMKKAQLKEEKEQNRKQRGRKRKAE